MIFLDKSTRLTQVTYQAKNDLFLLYLSKHLCPLCNFSICVLSQTNEAAASQRSPSYLSLSFHPLPQSSSSDVS